VARISISKLTVEFAVFGSSARSLKNSILAKATGGRVTLGHRNIVTVRAIDGLDLELRDGDRAGLVGPNGSGKSTLLRALSGIYKPTAGRISITGRVGTLLDPKAGLDLEATGYENIYLRGYLLGMTTREIQTKMDYIAGFTELGDFLSLPMKTYSEGMVARLAFAISTAPENDILLVDEGIGAVDEGFQEKAERRIAQIFDRASIVILASHSEKLLERFCNCRIRMDRGKLVERTMPRHAP
jgi:ABC-type polysaccharide/polyol phosphate transport system ATPase subunit